MSLPDVRIGGVDWTRGAFWTLYGEASRRHSPDVARRLALRQARALWLDVHGWRPGEIAVELGVPARTLRRDLSRAQTFAGHIARAALYGPPAVPSPPDRVTVGRVAA